MNIFEMMDPHFDPEREVKIPYVKIIVRGGLDILRCFVSLVRCYLSFQHDD
jgi:hypothetical protein